VQNPAPRIPRASPLPRADQRRQPERGILEHFDKNPPRPAHNQRPEVLITDDSGDQFHSRPRHRLHRYGPEARLWRLLGKTPPYALECLSDFGLRFDPSTTPPTSLLWLTSAAMTLSTAGKPVRTARRRGLRRRVRGFGHRVAIPTASRMRFDSISESAGAPRRRRAPYYLIDCSVPVHESGDSKGSRNWNPPWPSLSQIKNRVFVTADRRGPRRRLGATVRVAMGR